MSTSDKQASSEGSLIARLKRHSSMATISRSVMPDSFAAVSSVSPTGQIVRAIVLPPHSTAAMSPVLPLPETAETLVSPSPSSTAVPPPPAATPPVASSEAPPVPAVQQVSAAAALQPDDKVEQRLDTIMQRHRQKAALDGSEIIPGTPPPHLQKATPPLQVAATEPAPFIQQQADPIQDDSLITADLSTPPAEPEQPLTPEQQAAARLDTIMQRHRQKAAHGGSEIIPGNLTNPTPPESATTAGISAPHQPTPNPAASKRPIPPSRTPSWQQPQVQREQTTPTASPQPAAASPIPTEKGASKNVWEVIGRSARRLAQTIRGGEEEVVSPVPVPDFDSPSTELPESTTERTETETAVAPPTLPVPIADEKPDLPTSPDRSTASVIARQIDAAAPSEPSPISTSPGPKPPPSESTVSPDVMDTAPQTTMAETTQLSKQPSVLRKETANPTSTTAEDQTAVKPTTPLSIETPKVQTTTSTEQPPAYPPIPGRTLQPSTPASTDTHATLPAHEGELPPTQVDNSPAQAAVTTTTAVQRKPEVTVATPQPIQPQGFARRPTADLLDNNNESDFAESQALPLQSIWPVQHVAPVDAVAIAQPTEAIPIMRQPTPELEQVQTRLDHIPTAQPSDSSVAVMRPRRPRPGTVQTQTAEVPISPAAPALEGLMTAKRPLPAQPMLQKQSETASVPTGIGQLPPDLWRLIGQEPPSSQTQAVEADFGSADSPTAVIQRAEAFANDGWLGETASTDTALVQREEAEPAAASPASATDETTEEKKTEAEVDIDKLAREVYSELQHRLSIEWERLRGRYEQNW